MERIRQSFRRKKNKHKQAENTFDAQTVFDSVDDEEPKALSRIQKIRQSIRSLRKNKKKFADTRDDELNDDEIDAAVDKLTLDKEEEAEEEKDELSLKDEIEDEPLDKKSKFRLSFRKKKNKEESPEEDKKKVKKKKKKGGGKWDNDGELVRSNHCEFKVKYLGFVEVQESRGMEVCEAAMVTLVAKDKKPVKGKLHVTGDGLRVVDKKGGLLVDQVIEKVN